MADKPLTPEEFKEMCENTARIRAEISENRKQAIIKDFNEHGCIDVEIEDIQFMGVPYKRIFFTVPDAGRFSYDVSSGSLRRYCKIAHVVLRELDLL